MKLRLSLLLSCPYSFSFPLNRNLMTFPSPSILFYELSSPCFNSLSPWLCGTFFNEKKKKKKPKNAALVYFIFLIWSFGQYKEEEKRCNFIANFIILGNGISLVLLVFATLKLCCWRWIAHTYFWLSQKPIKNQY